MAKINIILNNKKYSIDESVLSEAKSLLQSHFSTTMSGSGATINLGGTTYNIDSTKLTAATNDFVSHLGAISGSGSSVTVNGVSYGVDSTKLQGAMSKLESALGTLSGGSTPDAPTEERLEGDGQEFHKFAPTALTFRSTAPLNELQEVQINGVTVDPSNYTTEEGSTVITLPIEYLDTLNIDDYEITVVSDSKSVKGRFSVVLPDINTYKFYYDLPYVGEVPTVGKVTAIFYENNIADVIMADNTISATSVECGEGTINIPALGVTCIVNDNGTEIYIPEFGATLILMWERTGGVNEHGLYYNKPYVYNDEAFVFFENGNVGYYAEGRLQFGGYLLPEYNDNTLYFSSIDVTGIINSDGTEISIPSLGSDAIFVLTDDYIYHRMKVNIGDYEYEYNVNNDAWSVKVMDRRKSSYGTIKSEINGIPVTNMHSTFNGCTSLTTAPVIPDSVTNMYSTFNGCTSLTTAPVIPDGVNRMDDTFYNCVSLVGTIIINANLETTNNQPNCKSCFEGTVKDIVLTGSSPYLGALACTANNGNVTVQ